MMPRRPQRGSLSSSNSLLLAACLYMLLTLFAQFMADIPPWLENSPLSLSTEFLACCGLVWTLLQITSSKSSLRSRKFWFTGSVAMALIWAGESVAEGADASPFWAIISVWLLAAVGLGVCLRHFALSISVRIVMQFGFAAQLIAHGVWALQDGLLHQPDAAYPNLEMITDTCELIAILSYIAALILSRPCLRDVDQQRHSSVVLQGASAAMETSPTRPRLRVCFPYIAQRHQILHSLPIAAALARHYPEIEVEVAAVMPGHLEFARDLVERHVGPCPIHYHALYVPWETRLHWGERTAGNKKLTLRINRDYFAGFDAVVTPERTSTFLRKLDLPQLKLIGTEHGAGDRAVAVAPELALFDFLLLPGEKLVRRLLERGYLRPGHYVSGIYSKFDWILPKAGRSSRLFDNDRPTVFYNPHFRGSLSSWPLMGWQVLDFFARSDRYNLIFAPHVRLFDAPTPAKYRAFERYLNLPHMRIDLGSDRCIDMSYTLAADLYLGDVSSQVVEFLVRPRPCVFLNPRRTDWKADPNYRFWELGPVLEDAAGLDAALEQSIRNHADFEPIQRDYLTDTLGTDSTLDGGIRGAAAIVGYLDSLPQAVSPATAGSVRLSSSRMESH